MRAPVYRLSVLLFSAVVAGAAIHPVVDAADAELCEMRLVPAGTFRTSTGSDVYLDTYLIGKYEVTNAQYCEFLNAGGNDDHWHSANAEGSYPNTEIAQDGPGAYHVLPDSEQHPTRFVSWNDAQAFCDWLSEEAGLPAGSYHLPTEAQWEKAAGWAPGRTVLWTYGFQSDTIDCNKCNYAGCGGDTKPVGSRDPYKSYYGCYDMSGNVWELCQDYYVDGLYPYPEGVPNPKGPETGDRRVVRGGSASRGEADCRTSFRNQNTPGYVHTEYGFRPARGTKLEVRSFPIDSVEIGGDVSGVTDYSAVFEELVSVTLTAPQTVPRGTEVYTFIEWIGDGVAEGRDVQVIMDRDRSVTAKYAARSLLSVNSVPIQSVWMNATSENGDRSGATDYSVWCDSLETVTVTAPETFPVGDLDYCFVQWTGDGDPYGQDVRVNMDGGKVVTARYAICQRVLRIRSETVLGESITGVPIAGAWPGDTPYDAVCDDEEVVNLAAPLNLVLDTTRYRFVRWVIDGSDQEDGQTELSVRMSTEHAVTAVYKEVLPQVIIKGPADRGEQPSPGGGGTFSVDVYLREVYDLAGMQAALKFLDPNSNDASFRISTMGGNPAFGGQAIQFNDALWPSIFPLYTDDRTTFGFVGLDGNMDIAEDTKVFSVTYEYGPSALGEYELVTDSLITELAGGDRTAIPFDLVAGHVSICTSHVLSVSAEDIHGAGIPGVPIDGTPTPYERQLCEGESVSLEAPADHAAGEVLYEFVRWILDGEQQPEGQVSVTVQMDGPHSVTAQYVRLHTLTVKSAPFSGVSVTGDKPGTTPYSKYCRDGETVSLLAAPSMTYNDKKFFFLYWFVNGSPRDRYLNPMSEEVTRDTEAVAVYDVTIQGDANSDCLVNILDLIKVRNELGKRCSTSP